MSVVINTKILLRSRPIALPTDENFQIVKEDFDLAQNGVVVRALYLSADPAMRGWIRDVRSYIPPVKIGEVMRSTVLGQVVRSTNSKFSPGDFVTGMLGWQSYAVAKGPELSRIREIPGIPLVGHFGPLGGTGLTAYFGLLEVGKPKNGETVLVSGAAGATGSVVGQIAKIMGCRVVGTAGTDDKCRWLTEELGFDGAINYKTCKNLNREIRKLCPKGVNVYFDNVGGDILDAALRRLAFGGRIVLCGAISQYNNDFGEMQGPKNYMSLLVNRGTMQGFILWDYKKQYRTAVKEMSQWILDGKLKYRTYIVDGIENAPSALLKLFSGENTGKMLIKVADPKGNSKL